MRNGLSAHIELRNGSRRVVLEHPEQSAFRCPACATTDAAGRERGRLFWGDSDVPKACPACGGELEPVVRRRQERLPEKYATLKAAEKAMRDELHEREHGDWIPPVDLTVRDYLRDRWQPSLTAEELAPSTIEAYKLNVKRIVKHIGDVPLQQLTRNDVAVMSAKLATDTSKRKGRPLSAETRRAVLVVAHRAFGDAVKAGLLRTNPVAGVKRPKIRRPEMHTWSQGELSAFLRATRSDRLGPLWHVLAMTGCRRGEMLGLKWSDVEIEAGRLSIQRQRVLTGYKVEERQTKTAKGRVVSIDAGTVEALKRQAAQQADDAKGFGDAWQATGHVFTREDGQPWHPDRIRVLFGEAVKTAKAPPIRMHDLRHGWATMALRAGVHPRVVQERLGHANIAITLQTYSHVLPDMQESAAEMVAALVNLSDREAEA